LNLQKYDAFADMYISLRNSHSLNVLKNAKEVLDTLGIEFWLHGGTCLGAIREKNFILHDWDIDLGVLQKDEHKLDSKEFERKGLVLFSVHRDPKTSKGLIMSFRTRLDFLAGACVPPLLKRARFLRVLDINVFYEKDEFLWQAVYYNNKKMAYVFSKKLFENLKEIEFLGLKVKVPNPVEDFLTEHFGEWRIPKKNWKYDEDPPCIKKGFL
jgi:phosphorylcholine metabolism protein LicD